MSSSNGILVVSLKKCHYLMEYLSTSLPIKDDISGIKKDDNSGNKKRQFFDKKKETIIGKYADELIGNVHFSST